MDRGVHRNFRAPAGMKSILDPSFHYTKSAETDLLKTFAKIRRDLGEQQQDQSATNAESTRKVLPFR